MLLNMLLLIAGPIFQKEEIRVILEIHIRKFNTFSAYTPFQMCFQIFMVRFSIRNID